jgi:hypothetical protein
MSNEARGQYKTVVQIKRYKFKRRIVLDLFFRDNVNYHKETTNTGIMVQQMHFYYNKTLI